MRKIDKLLDFKLTDKVTFSLIAIALVLILVSTIFVVSGAKTSILGLEQPPPSYVTTYYDLAIDATDRTGRVPEYFIPQNILKEQFKLAYDEKIMTIDRDWSISLKHGTKAGTKSTVTVRLGKSIYAIANIHIVNADNIITSAEQFLQLNGSKQTVIVGSVLDFEQTDSNISDFKGKIYFNHFPLINLKSKNLPLFSSVSEAQVIGLDLNINLTVDEARAQLVNISNVQDIEDFAKVFGAVAGRAYKTSFENITLKGLLSFKITSGDNRYYIGGVAGFLNNQRRMVENDPNISVSQGIRSYLDIEILTDCERVSYIECGGLFGIIKNASLQKAVVQSDIDIVGMDTALEWVSIGGIFGSLIKEYDTVGQDIYSFDSMEDLNSQIEILILADSLTSNAKIGGIAAYVQNVNLKKCNHDVMYSIKIDKKMTQTNRASIVAGAHNTVLGYSMTINGEDWSSFQ